MTNEGFIVRPMDDFPSGQLLTSRLISMFVLHGADAPFPCVPCLILPAVKRDMAERQGRTKAMLDALDAQTRLAMEGIRPGSYVRIRLTGEWTDSLAHEFCVHVCTRQACPCVRGGLGVCDARLP